VSADVAMDRARGALARRDVGEQLRVVELANGRALDALAVRIFTAG
jgi:hypothetical protein